VRWAAALPGSNGSVGMIGGSYFGNTQWMAALSKPPELKAIAPLITWSDPDDGLFSRGGAIELGITVPWSLMQGADTLMRRHPWLRERPGAEVVWRDGSVTSLASAKKRSTRARLLGKASSRASTARPGRRAGHVAPAGYHGAIQVVLLDEQ
jgi:predicted acyl esterase